MSEHRLRRMGTMLAATLVAALVLVVFVSGGVQAQTFSDVKGDEYFSAAVDRLSQEGVVQGRADGTFGAGGVVTRGQLAVFICRALDLTPQGALPFIDLIGMDWCSGEITALYEAGLVSGTGTLFFSPNEAVDRQQAITMTMRALAYTLDRQPQDGANLLTLPADATPWLAGYKDRSLIGPEHRLSVANANRLGVMTGSSDGWLFPAVPLNRGQMAVMLYRALYQPLAIAASAPAEVPADSYERVSSGSRGLLVQMLEERLTALRYPCGPVDGVYDYRTHDAVMAFQKVERLQRDGAAGAQVWDRLFPAQTPAPRYVYDGSRVEVDLTRQVLFMITDNEVTKIVHVSTGKLGTPTGRGKVFRKDPGWVHVPVGWMYSPSYVMPHIAIHGSKSVPNYPASHGCVRTPIWITDSLYDALSRGMQVDIYYS